MELGSEGVTGKGSHKITEWVKTEWVNMSVIIDRSMW
jgi:hypothetical protein